jgi:O-antigen/teichoic acid export membrane protein
MASSGPMWAFVERHGRQRALAAVIGVLRRWSGKVTLCIADQGFYSGAHFVLSLLLARWLAPSEYGAYALALALFLLAAGLHEALLLEPMGVIGPGHYSGRLTKYLWAVLWMHAGVTAVLALALLQAAVALPERETILKPALRAIGVASPGLLLFALFRRACYLKVRPAAAVLGSSLYAALVLGGLSYLWRSSRVSPRAAILLMGGAAALVSLVLGVRLASSGRLPVCLPGRCGLVAAAGHHWNYARWSLGTLMLYWLSSSLYLPLVGLRAGLEAVAELRAAENLLLPMSQTLTAVGLLLLPWLSSRHAQRGAAQLKAASGLIALLAMTASIFYVTGVVALGSRLTRWVYGGDSFPGYLMLVPFLGIAVILRAVGDTGFSLALRAAERPNLAFWSTAASAAVSLGLGLFLVRRFGAVGAAAGWMASSGAACLAAGCLFRWRLR